MNSEKPDITTALIKWIVFGIAGIGFLSAALICFFLRYYTWILAAAFVGFFLVTSAWKRLWLLRASLMAVREGREELTIFYRDGNRTESRQSVIPVGGDGLFFYGFSRKRNDTQPFRWNWIRRVLDNEKDITKEELLSRIKK
jgi:hypothetical protein